MKSFYQMLRVIFRIASRYFRGPEKWTAFGLLGAIVAIRLFIVWIDVRNNQWSNDFYNALQNKDWASFAHQLFIVFSWIAALYIITGVYRQYLTQWLQIRWRNWMTADYLHRWMNAGTHYRMRLLGNPADNPDQRISEDTPRFIGDGARDGALDIGVALLGQIVTLFSFLFILWNLSSATPLIVFGQSYDIPGYLVWTALIYSVIGTALTHWFGRPLVALNFDQQRFEADFRFSLVRLRENAEEVALLGGEATERQRLQHRFSFVVGNWFRIMTRQKTLNFFTNSFFQVAIVFPYIVVSPLYFSGAIELGRLMQIAGAFGTVQATFSFFVNYYTTLAEWRSVVNRLSGFEAALAEAERLESAGPVLAPDQANGDLTVPELSVGLPDGREIVRVANLDIAPADRVLVTGPTGSGKTSLFRALSGVWPFGKGEIHIPPAARVLVLPQRAYMPLGTLKGSLNYPGDGDGLSAAEAGDALGAVGLDYLVPDLDVTHQWANRLSGGEQQRIGIARAILQKPDWLLLDEATSALDEEAEAKLYRLLRERLPKTSIISIGHRASLSEFHDRFFTLKRGADGVNVVQPTTAAEAF